jgi:hypothetical protein
LGHLLRWHRRHLFGLTDVTVEQLEIASNLANECSSEDSY